MAATRAVEPGHSRAATCWSPDEAGTWSRSARCLHGSSSSSLGELLVLLEGRRGERGLLLKLLCGHRHSYGLLRACAFSRKEAESSSCTIASGFLRCCTSPLLPPAPPPPILARRLRRRRCRAKGVLGRRGPPSPFGHVPDGSTVFSIACLAVSSRDLAAGLSCSQRQSVLRCAQPPPDLAPAWLFCCSRCLHELP